MTQRLRGYSALTALVAGVATLANGVANLFGTATAGLGESGFGISLVLIGLVSWIAGVCLAKRHK